VPFYQPLASLEIFERAINGKDIATGKIKVPKTDYITKGPAKSTYREGISTIQFSVIPNTDIYNTTTNLPQPPNAKSDDLWKKIVGRQKPKHVRRKGKWA
jgi:carboxypeptidase D